MFEEADPENDPTAVGIKYLFKKREKGKKAKEKEEKRRKKQQQPQSQRSYSVTVQKTKKTKTKKTVKHRFRRAAGIDRVSSPPVTVCDEAV